MSNKPRHSHSSNELQTIAPAALAQVSGGATATAPEPTTSTTNDQILTALTGILDSLQSLAAQPASNAGLNQQELLLIMLMMQQRSQPQQISGYWNQPAPIVRLI